MKKEIVIDVNKTLAKKWHYFVVLIFGLILGLGIWSHFNQVMLGDDYAFHVERLQSASRAWSNGQIVPQVDPDALGGFGYAYNLFYGPLVTYVAAAIQAVVYAWPIAINLVLLLCLVLSGLLMCRTMTKISGNRGLAMLVAVFYMASPYFLNNIYSRMALGEIAAMVAPPILLLGLYQLTAHEKHAARNIAIAAALLLVSHSLSALVFGLMAVVYILVNILDGRKMLSWDNIWRMLLGVVVALGLTAFFTLPLVEAKLIGIYGVFDRGYSEVFFGANPQSVNDHRLLPQQLLAVDYGGASENSLALGVIALIGILGFWFIYKKIENKAERSFVVALWWVAVLAILATLPIIDWHNLPSLAWQMQFPWRLLMISATALSVVSGYTIIGLLHDAGKEKQNVLAIIAAVTAVYLVMPAVMPSDEHYLGDINTVRDDPVTVGWEAEYAPMQLLCSPEVEDDVAAGYACSLDRIRERLATRGTNVEILNGTAEISQVVRDGLKMEFVVDNPDDAVTVIELPMIYYPGYVATLDGKQMIVGYSSQNGLTTVTIPAHMSGRVHVSYGLSLATQLGAIISLSTLGMGVIWCIASGLYGRRKQKTAQVDETPAVVAELAEAIAAPDESLEETEEEDTADFDADKAEIIASMGAPEIPAMPEMPDDLSTVIAKAIEEQAEAKPKRKTKTTVTKVTKAKAAKSTKANKPAAAKTTKKTRATTTKIRTVKAKAEDEEA